MTPAERALLLAVAKHVHHHVDAGLQQRGNLFIATAAVEAEDVTVVKSCETCRFDISICGYSTFIPGCGWGAKQDSTCPTCNDLGWIVGWSGENPCRDACPTCNGGTEKADSRPLGEPCRSCTGHIREINPIRCAECSPATHQNYEWREDR